MSDIPISMLKEDNISILEASYNNAKVEEAINQMTPWKSATLDDLKASFLNYHWVTIKGDILKLVHKILLGLVSIANFNLTNIVLIPKENTQTILAHFCLVGL